MRALARERDGGGAADAARSAGDERDFVGEGFGHLPSLFVMPGFMPGIHVFGCALLKTWMAGTSPAMMNS
jgi:hypothetical protein